MGFSWKCNVGLLVVLLWGCLAAGAVGQAESEITVLINDNVGISKAILKQAEVEAGRIFHTAGIDITWVECSGETARAEHACSNVPGLNEFELQFVANGRTSSELVFGLAFLDEDGTGKYCNVFFDRVMAAHRQLDEDVSRLLGTVAAHELGHLLLGSHSHAPAGIMTAVWRLEVLRQMDMGSLGFTREQAMIMRARIQGDRTALVSVRASVLK
jgi:hypothetical protein